MATGSSSTAIRGLYVSVLLGPMRTSGPHETPSADCLYQIFGRFATSSERTRWMLPSCLTAIEGEYAFPAPMATPRLAPGSGKAVVVNGGLRAVTPKASTTTVTVNLAKVRLLNPLWALLLRSSPIVRANVCQAQVSFDRHLHLEREKALFRGVLREGSLETKCHFTCEAIDYVLSGCLGFIIESKDGE